MRRFLLIVGVLLWGSAAHAQDHAQDIVRVYGPGGPAPAMKEAAEVFGARANVRVEVVAGPTGDWMEKAKVDGDAIYSGSEVMMADFVSVMGGQLVEQTIVPLYQRAAAILVRPGNPKQIKGLADLFDRDLKILVVTFLQSPEAAAIFRKWGWIAG